MDLLPFLEKIGLTGKQAKVYLTCLELGGGKVSEIARKTNVKRTTCYHILNDLLHLGVVSKAQHQKIEVFIPEDPHTIEKHTEEKLTNIRYILPQLKAIHNNLAYKPKISFYEGWEGARVIYEDGLNSLNTGEELLNYTGFTDYFNYMPQAYAEDYIRRRLQKRIYIRIIAPQSPAAEEFKKRSVKELRKIKIVPAEKGSFSADLHIYKNRVGIISFKDNFMSVLIESKEIADMQRMAFELMWKGAEEKS